MGTLKQNRRRAVGALLGFIAATAVGASAASLGGLGGPDLGSDVGVVASCDTNGMDIRFRTGFHRRSGEYRVNRLIIRNVGTACRNLPYQLTLFDTDGNTFELGGSSLRVRNIRDRQPGPGVDRVGVAQLRVRFLARDVDRVAMTIGGRSAIP
jgi:hypothetical protein